MKVNLGLFFIIGLGGDIFIIGLCVKFYFYWKFKKYLGFFLEGKIRMCFYVFYLIDVV